MIRHKLENVIFYVGFEYRVIVYSSCKVKILYYGMFIDCLTHEAAHISVSHAPTHLWHRPRDEIWKCKGNELEVEVRHGGIPRFHLVLTDW